VAVSTPSRCEPDPTRPRAPRVGLPTEGATYYHPLLGGGRSAGVPIIKDHHHIASLWETALRKKQKGGAGRETSSSSLSLSLQFLGETAAKGGVVLRAAEEREGESLEGRETTRGGRAPPPNPNPEAAGGADRLRSSDVSPPPLPHPTRSNLRSPTPRLRQLALGLSDSGQCGGYRGPFGRCFGACCRACCSPAFTGGAGGLR
jgi:hypothetical protein